VGADPALVVELHFVDHAVRGAPLHEVGLHQPVQHRVVLPRAVGEPSVALLGGDVAPTDGDAEQLGAGVDRGRRRRAGFHGDSLAEPGEGGDDLAAGQADERVGAEDRRVVTVDGRVAHWCTIRS
jgi:hypothetical protein